jgi:hypothetical protein
MTVLDLGIRNDICLILCMTVLILGIRNDICLILCMTVLVLGIGIDICLIYTLLLFHLIVFQMIDSVYFTYIGNAYP